MSNPNYTDITVVLDRSGSMASVRDDTIGGYNSFLHEQYKTRGKATLTLVQFDTLYEVVYAAVPIDHVPLLNRNTFVPRGSTALLDALGKTIHDTGARLSAMDEKDRPGRVLFVVVTDGEENSSTEFSRSRVFEMIQHQREKYAWEFIYLGANQDAITVAQSVGINAQNTMTYSPTAEGTRAVFEAASRSTTSYRQGLSASISDKDRQVQDKLLHQQQGDRS